MKLLIDQNISWSIVEELSSTFPGSVHVRSVNLHTASDEAVWNFALENDFVILSKDSDFHQRSFLFGFPPKVIWLKLGNCTTNQIVSTLKSELEQIFRFEQDQEAAFLVIHSGN
ncbi:hypothetical protein EHQ27_04305 [Leptospira wolffii]|uniref:DUF5615 domain-containing protein n=1 Tax=Leptospira wolffii TaxID=409998 RepID=A0A2M9ZEK6_9LEPT|nr:hypothetical protein CH371_01235 [Leptospira wolffii]TGK61731.1 hypothetical protein EHQ32_02435 [Leptospira wolffii]TGK70274.1 hypothetical protein EHQ35_17850 [Leptospira wolffii]TGK77197.1 hypothetical protein EHQ27_04305 [Leptospira wolffii]TGL30950.1 hypothetical protein EHQ57_05960 [Leptospira wolffii]